MKIFIDTNIFLDLILKRKFYEEALIILNAVERHLFEGVILDITILNIDYIAKTQVRNVRDFLTAINDIIMIQGADNHNIKTALEFDNSDLEDNVQYITAKQSHCDLIVTNDKKFYKADLPVYSSIEFVDKYISTLS